MSDDAHALPYSSQDPISFKVDRFSFTIRAEVPASIVHGRHFPIVCASSGNLMQRKTLQRCILFCF